MAIFVSKTGANGVDIFSTISAAMTAAGVGETIIVQDGVYEEDVVIDKAVTLISENGQWDEDSGTGVKIVGIDGGQLGTIIVKPGTSNVVIGGVGQGFTIIGKDGTPAIEASAIYLQGSVSDVTVRGNDIVANGDGGLMTEYGAAVSNLIIENNIFSGQTFNGDTPAGLGSSEQFTLLNVPRQLVVIQPGASNVTFANNQITGRAGGINADGQEQGNSLVTIDAADSTIEDNVFTGFTNYAGYALRVRGDETDVINNTFDGSASGSDNTHGLYVATANPGAVSGNSFIATDGSNIIYADDGNDSHVGTSGIDTFSFAPVSTGGAYADLDTGVAFSGQTGFDTLSEIENLAGTSGNDVFFGDDGDNTFFASGGIDTVDGRGDGANGDTFDASNDSSGVTIDLNGGTAVLSNGTTTLTGIENATGGSGDDVLIGDAGDNILVGNGGNDTFVGNGGNDVIQGGEGYDTVEFTGNYEDYEISWSDGTATVSLIADSANSATIVDAGLLKFADKALYLVDPLSDEFATVQSAVDAAAEQGLDSVIMLAAGTYTEQVVVDGIDNLTIVSAPDSLVTIQAPADVDVTATSSSGRAVNGVVTVLHAENVVISGITVDGAGAGNTVDGPGASLVGVFYRNASGELLGVDIIGVRDAYPGSLTAGGAQQNVSGVQRGVGVQVDNDALMSFKMIGGSISDFQKNATAFNYADLEVSGVTVTGGGAQTIMGQNGFQASNSTGSISGNIITGIGYAGPSAEYSTAIMGFGNTDLDITDNTIVGANSEHSSAKVVGIYLLDYGAPNAGGEVTGNIVSFVDIGIALSGGVTDAITIENNTITDIDESDPYAAGVDLSPDADVTVPFDIEGSTVADYLLGAAGDDRLEGLAGDDYINGRDGDDTLIGGDGNDTLVGGAGQDTVILDSTTFDLSMVSNVADADAMTAGDQAGWQIATGAEGTKTIEGVEYIIDANGDRTLLVGGGGFATIAAALLEAGDGDTILVASGHVEPAPITVTSDNNGVTLVSVDGSAIIDGDGVNQGAAVRIEAGVENFTLGSDGHGFDINAGTGDLAAVYVVGNSSGITIEGNDVSGGAGHAVLTGGGMSDSSISGNVVAGDGPAAVVYVNGAASLGAANASDGVDISGNQISGGSDVTLLVGNEADNSTVSGNTFTGEASYAQLEVFGTGATIEGNSFEADGDVAIVDAGNAGADAGLIADQVSFAPGAVWVENPSGEGNVIYTSIQAAIDAAEAGATIHIGAGVFTENLVVNKLVHLTGEAGAVLEGALIDLVDGYAGLDEYFEANHPAYSATSGIVLQGGADGSSITGLTIQGFSEGVALGSVSGVTIEGNTFVNNVTGIRKGTGSVVSDLDIAGNSFSHGISGMNIYGSDTGSFDGVTMTGNSFSAMSEKGIYLEQVSNSTFTGNSFDDVGNYGRISPPFGGTDGEFGQAIDINLKSKDYSNVTFTDTAITNSGYSNQNGAGDHGDFGAAIGVKIRDDGSYASDPASFTGAIVFDGLTIDGTSTGVRVGEPGKDNDGPDVTLTNVTIENAMVGDIDNATDPVNGGTTRVEFSENQVDLDAGASIADLDVVGNASDNVVTTGNGDDSFTGGGGNDTFNGGAGTDTAYFTGVTSITSSGGEWTVVSADGTDTLVGVEIIEVGGVRTLLVGEGGFDSIQDAVAAAEDGDTILLAAGDYEITSTIAIDKDITIIGANGDIAGADGRTGESVLIGPASGAMFAFSGAPNTFVIDGVKIIADHIFNTGTPGDDFTITNSVLELTTNADNAIYMGYGGSYSFAFTNNYVESEGYSDALLMLFEGGALNIANNTFVGVTSVDGATSGINAVAMNINGSTSADATGSVSGNTFVNMDIGVMLAGHIGDMTVSDNSFSSDGGYGTGILFFDPQYAGTITIEDNSFQDLWSGIRSSSYNDGSIEGYSITVDGNIFSGNIEDVRAMADGVLHLVDSTVDGEAVPSLFVGGPSDDTILGTAGDDIILAGAGNDTITGGGGVDLINGGDGVDTVVQDDAGSVAYDAGSNSWILGDQTLVDVEIVDTEGAGGARTLLVGAGGFDTITEALAAAADGDTIMLADETFAEDVTITKGVTIVGADGGASTVTGAWVISTTQKVNIDGLTFRDEKPVELDSTDNFVALKILQHSDDGHVIQNSTFERAPSSYPDGFNPNAFAGSNNQQTHRAIEIASVGEGKAISILNNSFTGENDYTYAGDSWRSGIYSNGGLGTTLIEGNTFENVRSAINADDFTATVTITGNDFVAAGSAISLGGAGTDGSDLSSITDNSFGTVDTDFNFRGVPDGVVFDAGLAVAGEPGDGLVVIEGSTTGDDHITGTDGADYIIGNGGADHLDGAGGDDTFLLTTADFALGETIDGGTGDDTILFNAAADTTLVLTENVTGIETVEIVGSNNANLDVSAVDNALTINGNEGDNIITGTDHVDVIDGGGGIDTVVYATAETVSNNGTNWVVAGETLANVEIVETSAGRTLLVGDGGFVDIQSAIDAAGDGDTILVSAGTYESFVVTQSNLTIQAYGGDEVIVQGPLTVPDDYADMFDYASHGPSVGLSGSTVITVAASGTTLSGLSVQGANIGIGFSGELENITIADVSLTDVVTGIYKQPGDLAIDGLTITNVDVTDAYQGIVLEKSAAGGDVTGLVVEGLTLNHVSGKGIYAETLMGDTSISDLDFSDVGQFGRGASFGAPLGGWGAGIDINLKHGTYDGEIVIEDFTFNGVGLSDGGGSPHLGGAAITVKGRDDGSYSSNPAIVDDLTVTVRNGTIDGTATGIRQGEPGKPDAAGNVTGPTITVVDVVIANAATSEIDNVSKSEMIVQLGAADGIADVYEAGNDDTATGPIRFIGNADANTFTGGRGNDVFLGDGGADILSGGDGDDTFIYSSMAELLDDTIDGGAGTDTLAFETTSDTSIVLGAETFGMEEVTIGGAAVNLNASAVVGGLILTGNDAANIIVGTQGDDVIDAGAGNDTIHYTPGHGDDVLDGGAGLDMLEVDGRGAAGPVTYSLTGSGSTLAIDVADGAVGGVDATNVEKVKISTSDAGSAVTLAGDLAAAGIIGIGSQVQVVGGSGVDIVDVSGLTAPAKLLIDLGAGDDVFKGGRVDQTVVGGDGIDLIDFSHLTSAVAFNLGTGAMGGAGIGGVSIGNLGFEQVRGGSGNDVLTGSSGDNVFYASLGDDSINGREGFDIYSGLGFETGEGFYVSLRDGVSMGAYGVQGLSNIEGVYGTKYVDYIEGDDGDNWLDGAAGADTLVGGKGNDTYVANSLGDVVVELAGEGYDTVYASRHTVLWDNVEELRLTNGNPDTPPPNINGYGNDLDNWLYGNDGDNILDGKAGEDYMAGGAGDDTYYVDNENDVIFEAADEGYDQVFSYRNHFMSDNVEMLTLTGGGHIIGYGNELDNVIIGNAGKNKIVGRGGADILTGGGGADTFIYKTLSDSVVGNRDTITDFQQGLDKIDIQSVTSLVFDFLGEDATFAADHTAQLTFYEEGGNTIVEGDRNGDGIADLQIELLGIHVLTADDFLL